MAIRRPTVYRKNSFVFQDFLDFEEGEEELRFLEVKFDGEEFFEYAETSDYPPPDMHSGNVIARLDYTLEGKLITIDHWELNWRDEWPLRLATQYLIYCLYPSTGGYIVRVNKEALPFWVSERFKPLSNDPLDFLIK